MAETQLPEGLPPNAIPIVRSRTGAGEVYAVPAGRRLVITGVWISTAGSTTAATLTLAADVARDTARDLLAVPVPANSANDGSLNTPPGIPVAAGGSVDLAVAGATGGTHLAGFCGWECGALPGFEV